jgi:taurine dioxygenase
MTHTLSCRPLDIGYGVVIETDLSVALPPEQQAQLARLFNEHGLLVFHQQRLTHHQQIRAQSYLKRGRFLERDPDFVTNVGGGGQVGTTALPFHSDSAFLPSPIGAISLHAIDVVDDETTTRFSSGKHVYRRLPAELRTRIDGLHTLHIMPKEVFSRNRARALPAHYPRTCRLLVHRHPVTFDPVLYVSWVMIDGIVELSESESDALLDELHRHVSDPANVYEHRWRTGDLVIWDNIALLHARDDTSSAGRRVLQRVSTGAAHFSDLYPEFPVYQLKLAYQDR